MNKQILVLVIVAFILFFVSISLFLSISKDETDEDETVPEEVASITIENLTVNGQTEDIVLSKDDASVITATLKNETDEVMEITLSVRMDGELFDGRHDWTYTLEPGETKEIEETREVHHTWYDGEFTVEIGDQMIKVTVE